MFSWELEKFIKDRDFYIGGDDLAFLIDINKHPQINYIHYDASKHQYIIITNDNYYFDFEAMPIEEAKEKRLVKSLMKK